RAVIARGCSFRRARRRLSACRTSTSVRLMDSLPSTAQFRECRVQLIHQASAADPKNREHEGTMAETQTLGNMTNVPADWPQAASGTGFRERNVFGTLILAQAEINGLPQSSIGGHFLVGDLCNELRPKICNIALPRRVYERCPGADQRSEARVKFGKRFSAKPGTHLADIMELAILISPE